MTANATIKINSSSTNNGRNVDEEILAELKLLNSTLDKGYKKQSSGLLGGAGLLTKIGAAATAAIGGAGILGGLAEDSGHPSAVDDWTDAFESKGWWGGLGKSPNYEKIYNEDLGENQIVKTDEKTGEILEILSMREAEERNILDEEGNIRKRYERTTSIFDEMTKGLDTHKGLVMLNAEKAVEVGLIQDKEKALREAINEALWKQLQSMGGDGNVRTPGAGSPVLPGNLITGAGQVISGQEYTSHLTDDFYDSVSGGNAGFVQALSWIQGGVDP